VADTVCDPSAKEEIPLLVAVPPDRLTGVPKFAPSILNWTVPLGVPAPGATAVTVAVKFTLCPNPEGLADELTAVVESA
jgi:hypothetical protein